MLARRVSVHKLLAHKAYRRNFQYRASHVITNIASVIFGFIYIAIWQAATSQGGTGDYTPIDFARYVAFNQALLWVTIFRENGLGIPQTIRTGAISLDMMRPVDYHLMMVTRELGNVWYSFLFRTLPLSAVFAWAVGVHIPTHPSTVGLLAVAIVLAVYNGLCLHYIAGISAFWTLQSRWAFQLLHSAHFGLSGFMVPIDLLPPGLSQLATYLPFGSLQYYPARIYLELAGAEALILPAIWAVVLTVLCRILTRLARRTVEIQGG